MAIHNFASYVKKNRIPLIVATGASVACLFLVVSFAASSVPSAAEPELGSLSAPAVAVDDTTASGKKALQFGAEPVLPPPTPPPTSGSYKKLTPGTSWQWQLSGTVDEKILDGVSNSKKMYDIDLFDTPKETIARLKAKNIVVICYFSAGSFEDWRSDASSFPGGVKGQNLEGWPGEKWLDISQVEPLKKIMGGRMDIAVQKGCDGIEADNVDGYTNETGFPLTANNQITYNRMLAAEAHKRNLSAGLKNDTDQIGSLAGDFDWALNEECYHYNECDGYSAFIKLNKAVFGVEYEGGTAAFCPKANSANFDWLKKGQDLGATPRTACRNG